MRAVFACICLLTVGSSDAFAQAAEPDIAATPDAFDYETVTVGNVRDRAFALSNEGTANLIIFATEIQGPGADQFQVAGGGAPFTIGLGGTRQLTVQFIPAAAGPQSAVLTLFSNDPDESQLDLALRGTALAPSIAVSALSLDFGELLVALDSARTVILTNTGRANLAVSQTVVSGGDSTQFELDSRRTPFSLAPSDSLVMTVRFKPTTTGSKATTLRIVSNDLNQPELEISLSGVARTIEVDVVEGAALGEDVTVIFTLPQGFQPDAKELFYRSAGETAFRVAELTGTGPDVRGVIPGPAVTLSGVEYYVQVSDGDRAVTLPASEPQNQPLFLPVRIDQIEAPVSPQAWTYQMISVPLELADQDIEAVLLDDYGPYNTRLWRLFRWEDGDYVEYPAIQGSFAAGRGFWLITNDGSPFDVEDGQSIDPSEPFTLTLQPGWNQIGNPHAWDLEITATNADKPVRVWATKDVR